MERVETLPILEDDIILSGSPRMPRTWPDTGCMARIRNMIRAVRRGMAVSFLATLCRLDRFCVSGNLEIEHRIIPIQSNIGIDRPDK